MVELDLAEIRPSLAGPRRPQDRVLLEKVKEGFREALPTLSQGRGEIVRSRVELDKKRETIADGSVVIASITSCTNTSNPALMLTAGLLARKARELGLSLRAGCGPVWPRAHGP